MKQLFLIVFLFVSLIGHAQTPTDYPPVRTREVPEYLQQPVIMLLFIVGSIGIVLLLLYFFRFDKLIERWIRDKQFRARPKNLK